MSDDKDDWKGPNWSCCVCGEKTCKCPKMMITEIECQTCKGRVNIQNLVADCKMELGFPRFNGLCPFCKNVVMTGVFIDNLGERQWK